MSEFYPSEQLSQSETAKEDLSCNNAFIRLQIYRSLDNIDDSLVANINQFIKELNDRNEQKELSEQDIIDLAKLLPPYEIEFNPATIDFEQVYDGNLNLPAHLEIIFEIDSEMAKQFLTKLIDFSAEKSQKSARDSDEREKFLTFLSSIHESFFSSSENMFTKCRQLDQIISLGAKATQVPELRGWFGGTSVGDVVYDLTFSEESYTDNTIEKLAGKSVAEIIDIVDYLTNVGAQAIGEMYNADKAVDRTIKILKAIGQNYPSALVNYAVNQSLERLGQEEENPTISFMKHYGDRKEGRLNKNLSEELNQENELLQKTIQPDVIMVKGDKLTRIAYDAFAIIDQSNMPSFYAINDQENNNQAKIIHFEEYIKINKDKKIMPLGQAEQTLPLLLCHLHQPNMRQLIEDDLNIDLRNMRLNSQIQFLRFLASDEKSESFGRLREVLSHRSNSQTILKSFLSCADDLSMGNIILNIAENLPDISEQIFSKYGEIVDAAENVKTYLQENYSGEIDSEQTIEFIMQNLLRKGKDLLADFAENPREPEEIISALENYRTETLIFASTCRVLKQEGQRVNLEDFAQYGVDKTEAVDVTTEDRQEMTQIMRQNWSKADPQEAAEVLASLENSFVNPKTNFYILKFDQKIIGFMRFDELPDGSLYAASFNVSPLVQHQNIGEAALKSYLSYEAGKHQIRAVASLDAPILSSYIGKFGFVGTGIVNSGQNQEIVDMAMERNDQTNSEYRLFNANYGELAKYFSQQTGQESYFIELYNNASGRRQFGQDLSEKLASGEFVITAMKSNPDNSQEYLVVFERKAIVDNSKEIQKEEVAV